VPVVVFCVGFAPSALAPLAPGGSWVRSGARVAIASGPLAGALRRVGAGRFLIHATSGQQPQKPVLEAAALDVFSSKRRVSCRRGVEPDCLSAAITPSVDPFATLYDRAETTPKREKAFA
jgi:hypothetical protein